MPSLDDVRAGLTRSAVTIADDGPRVYGVAPVRGERGVVGGVGAGISLRSQGLREVRLEDVGDLVVFRDGRLIASTLDDWSLVFQLGRRPRSSEVLADRNQLLARWERHAATWDVGDGMLRSTSP